MRSRSLVDCCHYLMRSYGSQSSFCFLQNFTMAKNIFNALNYLITTSGRVYMDICTPNLFSLHLFRLDLFSKFLLKLNMVKANIPTNIGLELACVRVQLRFFCVKSYLITFNYIFKNINKLKKCK